MRIDCYREQHSLDGVTVLTLSQVEVPFPEVMANRLVDVTFQPPEEDLQNPNHGSQSWSAPMRFRYRVGDPEAGDSTTLETAEAEGMLLGYGEGSLLSFLERRYVPDETSERSVDRLLGQYRRGEIGRSDWIRAMEEALVLADDRSRQRRMLFDEDSPLVLMFAAKRSVIRNLMHERQDHHGNYFVRTFPFDAAMAVVTPYEEEVEGERVPRWRFALNAQHGDEVGGWDGRRYRVAPSAAELPESLARNLDRHGRVVLKPEDWFVPLGDLRVDYLVRVPYPKEVAHLVEAGPPPWKSLRKPALLVDTRRPVPLRTRRRDVFVVDDPQAAVAVLCRQTARGGYIPQMPAAPLEDLVLSTPGETPRFLAACWVR